MARFTRSRISAKLQDFVSRRREEEGLYKEIAEQLPLNEAGRLLDIGTGTGRQLKVIHEMKPDIELFGLDLSEAAIQVARSILAGIEADLRVGSIEHTSYKDDFFHVITCHSSMSYWKNPVRCFDEIYRILKAGGRAMLIEPQKDIDFDELVRTIQADLAGKSRLRRWVAANFNKYGLQWGRRFGLKLYSIDELKEIAARSMFRNNRIERISLQNLPIFARITLEKAG